MSQFKFRLRNLVTGEVNCSDSYVCIHFDVDNNIIIDKVISNKWVVELATNFVDINNVRIFEGDKVRLKKHSRVGDFTVIRDEQDRWILRGTEQSFIFQLEKRIIDSLLVEVIC